MKTKTEQAQKEKQCFMALGPLMQFCWVQTKGGDILMFPAMPHQARELVSLAVSGGALRGWIDGVQVAGPIDEIEETQA